MNIKSIEITGFKSFVDKVSLNFMPGITALVGPNGCGKSNIVDAFRWVMGEQSAKQLRGKTMEDIIFNGSETIKPLGMAEVAITFSNENGDAPFQYRQYSEIMVTRRLFRSGESEYSINKIPCRLKDITELFLDTGVGAKAYSIIEQGKVEQVINSKPQDRRLLIDEAAGISKYKTRKKEALYKIESTRNNLLRVDDIIVEVKRQLNSIKRQASKLKRYQDLKEEVKKIELNSSLLKYSSLKEKYRYLKEQLDHCKKEEIRTSTQISSIEATFEAEKIDLNEEEKVYHLIQEEIFKTSSLCQKEESRLEYLNKELLSAKDQHHQLLEQAKNINERMEIHQNEIKILEENNLKYNQKIKAGASDLINQEEQFFKFKEESSKLQNRIELEKNNLIDFLTELAHLNNNLTQMEKTHLTLLRKIENNKEENQNQATKLSHLEKEISALKDDRIRNEASSSQLGEEKVIIDKKIISLTEDMRQNEIALTEVREQWERTNSHLLSLQELQEKFEECDAGVRSIMLRDKNPEIEKNGICGLVADFIETEPRYETALEAVLGEKLHYVIVENQMSGIEAIEYLKTQSLGRASIVPIQIRKYHRDQLPSSVEGEKVEPLLRLVRTKEEYHSITNYLLNDVLLVDNFNTALKIWDTNGNNYTLVTLDGEIIDPAGIITGGRQNGAPSKILRKRREIKELKIKLSQLSPILEQLQTKKQLFNGQVSQLKEDSDKLLENIHRREINLFSLDKDITQLTRESDETRQRIELLQIEKEEITTTLKEASDEASKLQEEKEIKLSTKNEKESLLAQLQKESRNLDLQIDILQDEITKLKVQVAAEREKIENNLLILQRTKENFSILREEHNHILQRNIEGEQKQITLQNELQQTSVQIETYQKTSQEQEQSLDKKREVIVCKEEKLKGKEVELKDLRKSLEEIKSNSNDYTVQVTESNLTITHLIQDIDEKYHLNLENLLLNTPIEDIGEDENSYQRLDELRDKIERLGEVNLAASQEQEELTNRYQFLNEQREDLTKSLESLNLAIKKINRITKQRFLETYELINEKFKEVFPELLLGGRAELKLTDENNILETGIDIVVQPTGKKLQSIDLLSGGEKSLTAIALLMAIFLVKPSPFCLLDEADSALDDVNATRFNHYLKNISHNSKFILITHNKLSMQVANTLYGVTMQEPGVSKVVSVQLQ